MSIGDITRLLAKNEGYYPNGENGPVNDSEADRKNGIRFGDPRDMPVLQMQNINPAAFER